MSFSPILILSVSVIFTWFVFQIVGRTYALDYPGLRKHHGSSVPQIGGLVFGPLLLLIAWWLGLAPGWYIISGFVSILLGAADDLLHVPWHVKLTVQLALMVYIATIFWGSFNTITFYNYSFSVTQIFLLVIFLIWFVGIYNAVNLLDGLDGLAGGFMVIICIGCAMLGNGAFSQLNFVFAIVLLGFLVFNQRPAKLFMGDAGSLFLGFHTAVLPLLFIEDNPAIKTLNMTPFVLLSSYLIADTTRVFFTRLASRKSPMTADTIHFHHLILQQSGSYLASILSIYVFTIILTIIAVISFQNVLSANVMLAHLSLLLIFILSPPIQTYVPIITRIVRPFNKWQKNEQKTSPYFFRTLFIIILLIGLFISLSVNYNIPVVLYWQGVLVAILLLLVIIFLNREEKMAMYVVQLGLILFFAEIYWDIEFNTVTKLVSILLFVSYVIFILEGRKGCNVSKFSSLDLLIILIAFGGMCVSVFGFITLSWFCFTLLSLWFSLRFVLLRTYYLGL